MKRFPLLPRKKNTDKRAYGHVFVLAGSRSYPGAALLTARAALLAGAGLVTLGTVRSVRPAVLRRFPPEVMPLFFAEGRGGGFSKAAFSPLLKAIASRGANVVAVGPGLGRSRETAELVQKLVRSLPVPVVLDADGLNAFSAGSAILHRAPLILTPHEREFARLTGETPETSPKKREALAKKFSRLYDEVLVLKGRRTLVASHGKLFRNTTGNPGMAKGGSGDALTGIIAAFIAQGLPPYEASVWGVYFHGKAGDLAVKRTGELSLTATDLIDSLKDCWKGLLE